MCSLSDFYGMSLSTIGTGNKGSVSIAETKTSNKILLRDINSGNHFILKERPLYLNQERCLFTANVVRKSNKLDPTLVPIVKGENDRLHFISGDQWYVLMPVVEGFIPWTINKEAEIIGQQLALLHNSLAAINIASDPRISISFDLLKFSYDVNKSSLQLSALLKPFINLIAEVAHSPSQVQIIHGDISPSNVIYQKTNKCVFLDFDNISVGSIYYDIASLCLTFAQLNYQNNSSHLASRQRISLNPLFIQDLLQGYFRSESGEQVEPINVELFIKFYQLTWVEHMVLGAVRGDFTIIQAQTSIDSFYLIRQQLQIILRDFSCV